MTFTARHIITVTQGGILYQDYQAKTCWIDFVVCNRNWSIYQGHDGDKRCVGWRNTADVLDVEFFTGLTQRTRFEFISYVQRDRFLLDPMRQLGGWYTKDLTS